VMYKKVHISSIELEVFMLWDWSFYGRELSYIEDVRTYFKRAWKEGLLIAPSGVVTYVTFKLEKTIETLEYASKSLDRWIRASTEQSRVQSRLGYWTIKVPMEELGAFRGLLALQQDYSVNLRR